MIVRSGNVGWSLRHVVEFNADAYSRIGAKVDGSGSNLMSVNARFGDGVSTE